MLIVTAPATRLQELRVASTMLFFSFRVMLIFFLRKLCINHLNQYTRYIRAMLELLFVHYLALISCIYLLFVIIVCSIDFYVMKKLQK